MSYIKCYENRKKNTRDGESDYLEDFLVICFMLSYLSPPLFFFEKQSGLGINKQNS